MKKKDEEKRPVGRPVVGATKVSISVSVPIEIDNKLTAYALKNKTTKSAIVVDLLKNIL